MSCIYLPFNYFVGQWTPYSNFYVIGRHGPNIYTEIGTAGNQTEESFGIATR